MVADDETVVECKCYVIASGPACLHLPPRLQPRFVVNNGAYLNFVEKTRRVQTDLTLSVEPSRNALMVHEYFKSALAVRVHLR